MAKEEVSDLFIKAKHQVEGIDKNLSDRLASLKRKYGDVLKKYPSLTEALIESYYPKSLQYQVKAYLKDYPKAEIISSYSGKLIA